MITVIASASCLRCEWTATGTWAEVDKAAERHTRTAKHPTAAGVRPASTKTSAASPAAAAPPAEE